MSDRPYRLDNRVVMVTGGGTGIGAAIAIKFAHAGAKIILVGRREKLLLETRDLICATGRDAVALPADVGDPHAIAEAFNRSSERFGFVDCLINAAGIVRRNECPHSFEDNEWDALVNTNFRGVRNTMREFLARLLANRQPGVILNIASIAAHWAVSGYATYSATKAAVIAYTSVVATQYAKNAIRANCISPGVVHTAMSTVDRPDFEVELPALANRHPLGRVGEPEDIADMALFLCSDAAAWITGQNYVIDGGLTLGP